MTPKRIPIPSDLVLKVTFGDLYDSSVEPITIADLNAISLTFSSGGASITYDILPNHAVQDEDIHEATPEEDAGEINPTLPEGVTIVTPQTGDPYIIVCLCTQDLLPGQLALRSTVTIPDTRFHDGERKEVAECLLDIILT